MSTTAPRLPHTSSNIYDLHAVVFSWTMLIGWWHHKNKCSPKPITIDYPELWNESRNGKMSIVHCTQLKLCNHVAYTHRYTKIKQTTTHLKACWIVRIIYGLNNLSLLHYSNDYEIFLQKVMRISQCIKKTIVLKIGFIFFM